MKKALSLLIAIILTVSVFSFTVAADGKAIITPTEHGTVSYVPLKNAIQLTITPDEGYELDFGVILHQIGPFTEPVANIELGDLVNNQFNFTLGDIPEDELTISVFFKEKAPEGSITVTDVVNGKVEHSLVNTTLTLTITPNEGYELDFGIIMHKVGAFDEPIGSIAPEDLKGNEFTFDMTDYIYDDVTVAVFFKEKAPEGSITINDVENGKVEHSLNGTTLTLTITPNEGYELDFGTIMHKVGAFDEPIGSIAPEDLNGDEFTFDMTDYIYDDVTVSVFFKEKAPEYMKGDFDFDKEITVADALAALRIAAKLVPEDDTSIAIGDIDGDQHVTVADALAILRVAAKLVPSL